MGKAAICHSVLHEAVQNGVAIFDESAVVQGNSELCQRNGHLGRALAAACLPAGKPTVGILQFGQALQRPVNGSLYLALIPVTGQRLQGHGRDIGVRGLTGQGKPAVRKLPVQQIRQILCLHLGIVGRLAGSPDSQQRPDGAR